MKNEVQRPSIVAIGGGTGLSTMLRGLKTYTPNITAVVTVADDGGGSGMLRNELNILPPGDIRNCIMALSETEPLMEKLLRYRFSDGSLAGQSFGNLLLAAMTGISNGDFVNAIKTISKVLKVKGTVLPVTDSDIELVAILENGKEVVGESNIGKSVTEYGSRINRIFVRAKNGEEVKVFPDVTEKIRNADLITIGPGSLYTSILPVLAVDNIAEEILRAKAPVIYIGNIMTQPGETDGYTAYDHVEAILKHTNKDLIDYFIVNNSRVDMLFLKKYAEKNSEEVYVDKEKFENSGIKLIERNLLALLDNRYIRHNVDALTDAIIDISARENAPEGCDVSDEGVIIFNPKK